MNAKDLHRLESRSLNLHGASNFRDLGGYATADGRRVRWRRIFRSNHLGRLTEEDLAAVRPLGLKNVIDFRGKAEIAQAEPCRIDGPRMHVVPIDPGIRPRLQARLTAGQSVTAADARAVICDIYRRYVHAHSADFRALFSHLLEDGAPLVFHCTAGKDRTGVAAALILSALGVPREVVMQDYLLTRTHWKIDPATASGLPPEAAAVLTSVDEAFLSVAFAAIDSDFGGIDNYLRERMGAGKAARRRLERLYLEG